MLDDEQALDFWPCNGADNMSLSFDDWWSFKPLPEVEGFDKFRPEEVQDFCNSLQKQEQGEQFIVEQELQVALPKYQESPGEQHRELDVEEDEKGQNDDKKHSESNSKNFVSERNRRKRLNQQLFTLRSLVPNITKVIIVNTSF